MTIYRAYGLRIRSSLDFPELSRCDEADRYDVDIGPGSVAGPLPALGEARLVRFGSQSAYLAWTAIGRFQVTSRRVTFERFTSRDRSIRLALLGPVLAAVLQLRGIPLLHGSAVEQRDRALLLIGRKGSGKSTTAAAFAANGCAILSDDVLPLRNSEIGVSLVGGYSGLRVSSEAHRALLPNWATAGRDCDAPQEKTVIRPPVDACREMRVGGIVILDEAATCSLLTLDRTAALPAILEHAYAVKFCDRALDANATAALFRVCAQLANSVPTVRTRRSNEFAAASDLVKELSKALMAPA